VFIIQSSRRLQYVFISVCLFACVQNTVMVMDEFS